VDHIGGNSWVKERAPHARFGLGALDTGWAEDVDRHYCQLYKSGSPGPWEPDEATAQLIRDACGEPVAIDHPLVGGEVLQFGAGREIETIHLGAHSPGQMLYIDRTSASVFSGDAVQQAGIFNSESNTRDFPMYKTVSDYLRSLSTIRSAKLDRLCTAHAGVYDLAEADEFIDSALDWTAQYTEIVHGAAQQLKDFSLEEMVDQVHHLRPEYSVSLQIRVTTSEHLDELVRAGTLRPRIEAGEKRWSTGVDH
jgi:glyoxylase-like metal-dependent hydrolase (beta-lactamase superfamily II)